MKKWVHDHSLSLTVIALWALLTVVSFVWYDGTVYEWFSDRAGGHADDAFGAIIIIVGTKFLLERGKKPSKESR